MRDFLEKIKENLQGELPGPEAHYKIMKSRRTLPEDAIDPKQSAVLLALYPDRGSWHTVLILRNSYEGVHSNQVSLPGGKFETSDKDLQTTALREANEEVNIEPENVEIIGSLTPLYVPPSNFIIQPFVGVLEKKPQFIPDPLEVKKIIQTPVLKLLDPNVIREKKMFFEKYRTNKLVTYFDLEGHTIWGATAMILSEFKEIALR